MGACSQGFTLGYYHIAPQGRDISIALLSQGFTLSPQRVKIARWGPRALGYFHIAPPGRKPVP